MANYNIGTYAFGYTPGNKANREDLLALITNVDPTDTPFVTQAPRSRATHVVHEWLTDTLATASTAGAVEGDDFGTPSASTAITRVSNQTQIFRKDIGVTETQRAVNPAAFKDAYAYEIEKASREIARNIEKTVFAALTSATGASNAARVMKTLENFLTTNVKKSTDYNSASTTATASAAFITANDFNAALEQVYTNGGTPEQAYVSPSLKRQISAFTQTGQTRNIAATDAKLALAIDIINTDFGPLQIVLDRWVPQATNTGTATAGATDVSGRIFFVERSKARTAWLRPLAHTLVGKRGDYVAGMCVAELTLEVLNQAAFGTMQGVNNKSANT